MNYHFPVTSNTETGKMKFDDYVIHVKKSDWNFNGKAYSLDFPILGPSNVFSPMQEFTSFDNDNNLVVFRLESSLAKTIAYIEIPPGTNVTRENFTKEISFNHYKGAVKVSIKHKHSKEHWEAELDLHRSAIKEDQNSWNIAWERMKAIATLMNIPRLDDITTSLVKSTVLDSHVAYLVSKQSLESLPNWTCGAAYNVLFALQTALYQSYSIEKENRLKQLLTDGGLSRNDVLSACKNGLLRTVKYDFESLEKWSIINISHHVNNWKQLYMVYSLIVNTFNITEEDLVNKVMHINHIPISVD